MIRCTLLSLFLALGTLLAAKELPTATTISAVKVFLSGAEITRTGKAALPAGSSTIVFTGLSEEADPANIQVNGQGAFTILSVTHRLDHHEEKQDRADVKELEERIEATEGDLARENALIAVMAKEQDRLVKNDVVGGDHGASLEQLRTTSDYMQQRLEAIALGTLTKQKRVKELNEQLSKLRLQLTRLKGKRPSPTSEVVVEVSCTAAVEARFTLKYLVASAGWSPSYDIRVNDVARPLGLTYKALVYQNTGEAWNDVSLALSSGDPGKGAAMPVLNTWLLDYGARARPVAAANTRTYRPGVHDVRGIVRDDRTGEPLPFVTVALIDDQGQVINGTTTNMDGYYAIAVPEGGRALRFTYVGYKTQGTPISGSTINQALSVDGTELSTVAIVSEKRVAVSRMAPLMIEKLPDAGSDLSAYMDVAPGTIGIRGSRTGEGAYYVDGIAVGGGAASHGDQRLAPSVRAIARTTDFEFAIQVPYTIPSDGQNHSVGVREEQLAARYRYYCTPKLDLDAFLFAKVTGWETMDLLPGPAHVYFEGTYVGESELDPSVVGDTLDLSLGRDQGVRVQRTKRKDFSQKQTVGGKRTDRIAWEIGVRNNKAQAIELIITDQFPVAARSEIEVELTEGSGAQVDRPRGFLTWRQTLAPRTDRTWAFSYSVKYPKEADVRLE